MNREARIASAKATSWVTGYQGKNLIKGYSKWYGVNLLTAITELRMLGVKLDPGHEDQAKASMVAHSEARQRRQEEQAQRDQELYPDSDGTTAYIAGDTSSGTAYGILWEEP